MIEDFSNMPLEKQNVSFVHDTPKHKVFGSIPTSGSPAPKNPEYKIER